MPRKRNTHPQVFESLPAPTARALADKTAAQLRERPQPPTPCAACIHPQAADINFSLLIAEAFRTIQENFGLHPYSYARTLRTHRDIHLMPLIEDSAETGALALQTNLYPPEGDEQTRRRWYLMQAYGIRGQAIKEKNWGLA